MLHEVSPKRIEAFFVYKDKRMVCGLQKAVNLKKSLVLPLYPTELAMVPV